MLNVAKSVPVRGCALLEPVQEPEQGERADEVVDGRVVHDDARHVIRRPVAGRERRVRDPVSEGQARSLAEMVGDRDVADPSDHHADDETRSGGVQRRRDVELLAPEVAEPEPRPPTKPPNIVRPPSQTLSMSATDA